jgi:Flp pilus assembly secretin CpaC
MHAWVKSAGWCCLVVCGFSVHAADVELDTATKDWAHEAETAFRQVRALHAAAAELRAAGIEDLARAATDRAAHLEQRFITQLRSLQHGTKSARVHNHVQLQHAGALDRLLLHCRLVEVKLDSGADASAKHMLPRIDVLPDDQLLDIRQQLKELLASGDAKVLAEPTLLTINGQPAKFETGGEVFPVPISKQGNDGIERIELRHFGVMLDALPRRQPDGRWRIGLNFDVTERDENTSVQVAGMTVPGLRKSTAAAVMTMSSGQTLAVTGVTYQKKNLVLLVTAEDAPPELGPHPSAFSKPTPVLPSPPPPEPIAP